MEKECSTDGEKEVEERRKEQEEKGKKQEAAEKLVQLLLNTNTGFAKDTTRTRANELGR
ncbi:MAG: hypothetical protein LBI29_00465 [Rickettsiales bacterium]|jgi:hypothetical protein|nr:hypothetical protein [Rickettsiales bacterium]